MLFGTQVDVTLRDGGRTVAVFAQFIDSDNVQRLAGTDNRGLTFVAEEMNQAIG